MYASQRRHEILTAIEKDTSVSVIELANQLGVSQASIRRDLNELSNLGLVQRTHGGAVRMISGETPFSERMTTRREEKARIGKAAASYVLPGETIFIDGGTTTECMVAHLAKLPGLTVVTCGLNIVNRLVGMENVTVIVIGGTLHHLQLYFGGMLSTINMQACGLRCGKTFLAASAVSSVMGITNSGLEEIHMKRKAIEMARETYVLADSSKLGGVCAGLIAPATDIHHLVTGREAPEMEVNSLRQLGLTVHLV
jgi:DeoR/GlpR family transcriptional regulator of sugar metabolism